MKIGQFIITTSLPTTTADLNINEYFIISLSIVEVDLDKKTEVEYAGIGGYSVFIFT